jgi:hypothetical protein
MVNWRVRGWILLAAGLFLVLLMGAITIGVAPAMLDPGVETGGTTFTGSDEQAQVFLGLFALVILFGALCIVNGLYMIATGARSRVFTIATLAFAALLYAAAWAIRRKLIG